ncbi:MAG: hypothetical protein HQK83_15125 [Fibrobacteria bacterium]|nr:hypothetical protein [Fibrobacteria bacterium]
MQTFKGYYFYPQWYGTSLALNRYYSLGKEKTKLILGNSFTQTAINPRELNSKNNQYVVLGRGGSATTELMYWVLQQDLRPPEIIVEVNGRNFRNSYPVDYDLIYPESSRAFDLFKHQVEVSIKFQVERILSFMTYDINLGDYLTIFRRTGSVIKTFESAFFPGKKNHMRMEHPIDGHTPESRVFNHEEIKQNTRHYYKHYKEHMESRKASLNANLTLLRELSAKFLKKNIAISFIRLPRDSAIVNLENKYFPELFMICDYLAATNTDIRYIDLSKKETSLQYQGLLSDGAHWSREGSKQITAHLKALFNSQTSW